MTVGIICHFLRSPDLSTGAFTIPGAGLPVSITIVSASWLVVGQCVWISDGTHQLFADVTTVASGTSIGITNRGYNGNALSGTMAAGAAVRCHLRVLPPLPSLDL